MIIHDLNVNKDKQSFTLTFSPQNSDIEGNYLTLQNLTTIISLALGITITDFYNQMINDINRNIERIRNTPPQEFALFIDCNSERIVVGNSGGSGLDFSVIMQ